MPYVRPTLDQINARIQADIKAKIGTQASFLRRSWLNIFGRVLAGAVHLLYGYIQWAVRQLFIVSADDESVIKKAALYGLARKAPAFASGMASFTGTAGVTVPSGTIISTADGVRYQTTVAKDLVVGPTVIAIRAMASGESGNLDTGEALILESPLAGVNDEVTVFSTVSGGADIESIDALKARYLTRVQRPPQGGSKADYELWAKELPFVGLVMVYAPGEISSIGGTANFIPPVGEVWVYFANPESTATPSQAEIDQVQAYLNVRKPVTATVQVKGIVNRLIQIAVAIKPSATSTLTLAKQDVKNALKDMIGEQALPTATLYLSQINEAISRPSTEIDHTVSIPAADIVMGVDEIGKLDEAYFDANATLKP